jgi:MFS family permease
MSSRVRQPPLGRRFRLLLSASVCSGLGNGMAATAFPLLAARMTDDARLVVGVTVASYLPWLLFGLPAGVLGDRYRPERLVPVVEGLRSALLLAFAVVVAAGSRPILALYAVVFLITSGDTIFTGVTHAVVPRVAPPDGLARANGLMYSAQTASENVLGPALGGVLFVVAASLPFVLDGASFVVSGVLALLAVRGVMGPHELVTTPTTFRTDLREGVRYFRQSSVLPVLLVLITGFAFCQAVMIGPLVLFALHTLHLSSAGFGMMVGISSIGNVVGSMAAPRVLTRFAPTKVLRAAGLVVALSYLLAGISRHAVPATAALTLETIAVGVGVVAHVTLRQQVLDPAMFARAGNIFRTATMGIMPVGALVGGVLAQSIGLRAPLIGAAALQFVIVLLATPLLARRCGPAEDVLVPAGS